MKNFAGYLKGAPFLRIGQKFARVILRRLEYWKAAKQLY